MRKADSPFDFYEGLNQYITITEGRGIRKLSQTDAFRALYGYATSYMGENDTALFEELMHKDFSANEARRMPLSVISKKRK